MIDWSFRERGKLVVCAGFAGALFFFIYGYATTPLADFDFWWHLKSGEVMVQNRGLLSFDPFAFTGDGAVSSRETLILRGYWLWELIAYGLYALLGFNGIFLLNLLTLLALVGVVLLEMRRQSVGYVPTLVLLTLGLYLLQALYPLERPQILSFLGAAILLGLLARVRDGGRLGWSLPLLMLFWANLHGGFVVGDLLLLVFFFGAIVEYRHDLSRIRPHLFWIALGLGASLLNPNGGLAFLELVTFHNSALMIGISEYQSTWTFFQQGYRFVAVLWLLIALYGFGLWSARRLYWPEVSTALFLALFSLLYLRNVGFFALAMLPSIGFSLQQGWRQRINKFFPLAGYLLILAAAALLLVQMNARRERVGSAGAIASINPEGPSRFILDSGLIGRMFNSYNYGGYLLWRLYPQHRVFIDGRGLDPDVYLDWKAMTSASLKKTGGRQEFEVLLERYNIDYVVQSHIFSDTGRLTPLLKFLLVKAEWIPVYVDEQSYILVRNSQKNAGVIGRYGMDKNDFNQKVIAYLTIRCQNQPAEVVNHVALAEILIFVGRYAEAEERLGLIARLQPDNPDLSSLRNQLEVLKNGKQP